MPSACEVPNSALLDDDTNIFYPKDKDELFLLNKVLELIHKWLSINKLVLNIDKTQTVTLSKNQGDENRLSDSTIERSNCLNNLSVLIEKYLYLNFLLAEIVKNCQNNFQ